MRKISGRFGAVAGIPALMGMLFATAIAAPAQTFKILLSFDGTNGRDPNAALVQGLDGSLYGTTSLGGSKDAQGTAFKVAPTGTLTTLYSFCAPNGCKYTGDHPAAGLVQAPDGNFYGTAPVTGANGWGTVFEITPAGNLTIIYNFCSQTNCTDGATPVAGLTRASDGNFYGTTKQGGANNSSLCYYGAAGCGTIFKITPTGTLTTLYSFCAQLNCSDGDEPVAGLVQGSDGEFYGTTSDSNGYGTVFEITPSGTLTTLYSFNLTDGDNPLAGLIQGTDGNFYGTTTLGGANGGGTLFKVTPSGTLTTLYDFCAQPGCTDGEFPAAGLVQATDGNFYGTTQLGGTSTACNSGCGTIFKMTPAGMLTTLHSFDGSDGRSPEASLVQATSGAFYGTATLGGSGSSCSPDGCGTVFSVSVGLGPFVETLPTSGKAGAVVKVLGTHLTGATSVTFNGAAAVFKVISPSEIGTSVPTGATTGPLKVVTPTGTLTNNVNFQVLP
ncbi:MAG TPA: choice-of-anchor tandem repeat GloVer-containing protein [Terriglobales bacterium]